MTLEPIKNNQAFHDLTKKFVESVTENFGDVVSGTTGNDFFGTLFYVYVPLVAQPIEPANSYTGLLKGLLTDALKDEKEIEELARLAREHYRTKIAIEIRRAAEDLREVAINPLEAASRTKIIRREIILSGGDEQFGRIVVISKKVIDGVLVRQVEKRRGRPPVWTHAKLEQKIRGTIRTFRKRKYRSPTIAEAADELKMPVATLKKLLQRHDLLYSAYKKET